MAWVQVAPTVAHELRHVPDAQAVAQHSLGEVQEVPGLPQNWLEVQVPAAQSPEQHSEAAPQVLPPGLQEHTPESHTFEQQSELRVQLARGASHAHLPAEQTLEQHSVPRPQVAPAVPQVDTGWAQWLVPSQ